MSEVCTSVSAITGEHYSRDQTELELDSDCDSIENPPFFTLADVLCCSAPATGEEKVDTHTQNSFYLSPLR